MPGPGAESDPHPAPNPNHVPNVLALSRVVRPGAISLQRVRASNGAAASSSEAPHPAQEAGPPRPGQGGAFGGNDPLELHLARARAGVQAPRPVDNTWKHLRYNVTSVYADAVTRATMHREYNHSQHLPLHGIDTAMYYREEMPPTQDQAEANHLPRPPPGTPPSISGLRLNNEGFGPPNPGPPPSFNGMLHNNEGFGLHDEPVNPPVPIGSFSIAINRLMNRVSAEQRTFCLHEDNVVITHDTTLVKISEQDVLLFWHMLTPRGYRGADT